MADVGGDGQAGPETGTIWPPAVPADPEPAPAVAPAGSGPAPQAGEAAQQFPDLDPELLTASVEVTSAIPAVHTPTRRQRFDWIHEVWLATRIPLLLAVAVLLAISVPRVTAAVVNILGVAPVAGSVAIAVWVLYALPLIWIIRSFDFFEAEPTALLVLALAWGGIVATSTASLANAAGLELLAGATDEEFASLWGPAIVAPTTEELVKAVGIVAAVLLARRAIRGAIDGFVIGAMVGLGFQVVENFTYTANLLSPAADVGTRLQEVVTVFFVRGIGSGLWSHAAYSGIVGLGIGYAFTRTDRPLVRRVGVALLALAAGWLLHALWNAPDVFFDLGPASVVVRASLIVGLLVYAVARNQRRDSGIYVTFLEAVHDPALVTAQEIEDLRTYASRQEAVRRALRSAGGPAGDAVRALQRAQADLSVALANGDLAAYSAARKEVLAARQRTAAAAVLPPAVGHAYGVAAIWLSVVGVLVPVLGPLLAAAVAGWGFAQARRAGAEPADSLRAALAVAALSLVVGLGLLLVIGDWPAAG
jgi:RsiW-degrading membrane proteinase PrsW (M82 family)